MAEQNNLSLKEKIRAVLRNSSWEDGITLDQLMKATKATNSPKVISILRDASWAEYSFKRCRYLPAPGEIQETKPKEMSTSPKAGVPKPLPASVQQKSANLSKATPAASPSLSTDYKVFRIVFALSGASGLSWEDICSKLTAQERPSVYRVLKYAPWVNQVKGRYYYRPIEPQIRSILSQNNASQAELEKQTGISDSMIMRYLLTHLKTLGIIEVDNGRIRLAHKPNSTQGPSHVTKTEQADEISLLNERILQDLQTKHYSLLGQINISNSEYRTLLDYTKYKLSTLQIKTIVPTDLLLSVAMVQIAIRTYGEEKFWYCVAQETGMYIPTNKLNYVGKIFLRTIADRNLFIVPKEAGTNTQYVENIKAHAFVINSYLQKFFDFTAAYYERNLLRNLTSEIQDDFEELSVFMTSTLSNDGDTIIERDLNAKTSKFYRLLKSTRSVFAYASPETIYNLFYPCLQLMDAYFYDDIRPQETSNRFEKGFLKWCDSIESRQEKDTRRSRGGRSIISRRPYFSVSVDRGLISVVIPPQKFRHDACDGKVSVTVTIGSQSITNRLALYRSFGMYISEELRVPVSSLFDEVHIQIEGLKTKKYSIPTQDFRFFDSSWNSIPKLKLGKTYVLSKKETDIVCQRPEDLIEYSEHHRKWQSHSLLISDESVIYINRRPFSLAGEYSPNPVYPHIIENYTITDIDGKPITGTTGHPLISFLVEKQKLHGTAMLLNGKRFPLDSIETASHFEWSKDRSLYAVSVDLASVLPQEDNRYRVSLDVPSEPNRTLCDYLVLSNFQCYLNKELYIYERNAELFVVEQNHSITTGGKDWTPLPSNIGKRFSVPLIGKEQIAFQIDDVYWIHCPVHLFQYGFSQREMRTDAPDYLWYKDIGETLYLNIPKANTAKIRYLSPFGPVSVPCHKYAENAFRADISSIKNLIFSGADTLWHHLEIEFEDGKTNKIKFPQILRKLYLTPYFKLRYLDGHIYCDIEKIKGNANAYLTVINEESNRPVVEALPIFEGRNEIPGMPRGVFCSLFPYMEEEDEFGFYLEKTELKSITHITCEDWNELEGCILCVKTLADSEKALPSNFEYFIALDEKIREGQYLGSMYGRKLSSNSLYNERYEKDNKGKIKTSKLGKALITVTITETGLHVFPQLYSYVDEAWRNPYYDSQSRML